MFSILRLEKQSVEVQNVLNCHVEKDIAVKTVYICNVEGKPVFTSIICNWAQTAILME